MTLLLVEHLMALSAILKKERVYNTKVIVRDYVKLMYLQIGFTFFNEFGLTFCCSDTSNCTGSGSGAVGGHHTIVIYDTWC